VGYRREPKQYKLIFEDPGMAGLEVVARSLSIGEFAKVTRLADQVKDDSEATAGVLDLFEMLGKSLASWNLEDEVGDPVPADYEGIKTQELDFILAIVSAWISAIADVTPPLPAGSNSGGTSPEASLPMEPLSPSPPN
jgi:hypothetical protein